MTRGSPKCFISYSHSQLDELALRFLVNYLRARGVDAWWDGRLEAERGLALNAEIAAAIAAADVVVVLASSQSMSSRYCHGEISYCMEQDKAIIRVVLEPVGVPPALLPLAAAPTVVWHDSTREEAEARLAAALRAAGIAVEASAGSVASGGGPSFIDDPDAALIRPSYGELLSAGPDRSRDYARRLVAATRRNPANGYNHLSISLLWLFLGDGARGLESARAAVASLPREANAHYAEALTLCASRPHASRTLAEVEEILRRLATARRLPKAGAHIDLLSASVIANYYLPRYLAVPADPNALLAAAASRPDRCRRMPPRVGCGAGPRGQVAARSAAA